MRQEDFYKHVADYLDFKRKDIKGMNVFLYIILGTYVLSAVVCGFLESAGIFPLL